MEVVARRVPESVRGVEGGGGRTGDSVAGGGSSGAITHLSIQQATFSAALPPGTRD